MSILPVLDEADAIPRVLDDVPRRVLADRRRQRVDGRLGNVARRRRARRRRTVNARLRRRVPRRTARVDDATSFASWTATRRSILAISRDFVAPVVAGDADLVLGARRADRGAWAPHACVPPTECSRDFVSRHAGVRVHDLGPMRVARPRCAPRTRRAGSALRLSAGDGVARRACRLAHPRDRRRLPRPDERPIEGHRQCLGNRPRACGTCRSWRHACDHRCQLDRHRQGAAAGSGQDAAVPAVHSCRSGRGRRGGTRGHPARGAGDPGGPPHRGPRGSAGCVAAVRNGRRAAG